MKIVMTLLAITLCIVSATAEDLKVDWSVESGNSTDWGAMIAQAVAEAPVMVAQAGEAPAEAPVAVVANNDGAVVRVDATEVVTNKKGFWAGLKKMGQNIGNYVVDHPFKTGFSGLATYGTYEYGRREGWWNGSSSGDRQADSSFNQSTTDNTRSCGDNRGATITLGDGATWNQSCPDSSSSQ